MLVAMAVWDTVENGRSWMTRLTLESLARTVDWERHHLVISDNGSCQETQEIYNEMGDEFPFVVIRNGENIGTARAINVAWHSYRPPGVAAVKMDNDVVIHQRGWADWMEDVFARDPSIGICGLKRKDLAESPFNPVGEWSHSEIRMLPHEPGQRWLIVEEVRHVMGTCQAYSPLLLEKIGYLYQMQDMGNLYGYDDSLASFRSAMAGFRNVFLHGFEIDHVDPGATDYTRDKEVNAGAWMKKYHQVRAEYLNGTRDVYYDGEFK